MDVMEHSKSNLGPGGTAGRWGDSRPGPAGRPGVLAALSRVRGGMAAVVLFAVIWVHCTAAPLVELWRRTDPSASPGGMAANAAGLITTVGNGDAGFVVTRFRPDGRTLWRRTYGSQFETQASRVMMDADGHAWVSGQTPSTTLPGVLEGVTIRYSPDGQLLWEVRGEEHLNAVHALDGGGNLYLAGVARDPAPEAGQEMFVLTKLSPGGAILFQRRRPAPTGLRALVRGLALGADGSVTVVGWAPGSGGVSKTVTLRWDSAGTFLWEAMEDLGDRGGFPNAVAVDAAGNAYVAASTRPSLLPWAHALRLTKHGPDGARLWSLVRPGRRHPEIIAGRIWVQPDGTLIVGVRETSPSPSDSNAPSLQDAVAVAFDPDGREVWSARIAGLDPVEWRTGASGYVYLVGMRPSRSDPTSSGLVVLAPSGVQVAEHVFESRVAQLALDGADHVLMQSDTAGRGDELRKLDRLSTGGLAIPFISPVNREVILGQPAEFEAVVEGGVPVGYQWKRFGQALPGETNRTLRIGAATEAQHGAYTVSIETVAGTSTSSEARLVVRLPPTVADPIPMPGLPEGRSLRLSLRTGGEEPLFHQWRRDGVVVEGATNWWLEFPAVMPNQAGRYSLHVSNAWGTAASQPFRLRVVPPSPLDDWQWQHPRPQGNDLHGAAYGNGRFVVVGLAGTVLTSSDGTNWVARHSERFGDLNDVAFADGRFVAVGDGSRILTSSDGLEWEQRVPPGFDTFNAVVRGNGLWVAVGTRLAVSTNGLDWDLQPWPGEFATDIAFGGGRFMALNSLESESVLTSTNGVHWAPVAFNGPRPGGGERRGITYADDRFVVVSGRISLTSTDGRVWVASSVEYETEFNDVVSGPGRTVAVGEYGDGSDANRASLFTSTNGLRWARVPLEVGNNLHRVAWAGGRFLAMGDDGHLLTSIDGLAWRVIIPSSDLDLEAVARGGDRFVAVGDLGQVFVSRFGTPWTQTSNELGGWLTGIAYGAGRFVAVGWNGEIRASIDGQDWIRTNRGTAALSAIVYADGRFVAGGDGGRILASPDGLDWVEVSSGLDQVQRLAHGAGRFVALGATNTIATSVDGIRWRVQSLAVTGRLCGLAYGNGRFLLCETTGSFLTPAGTSQFWTSEDGLDWRKVGETVEGWVTRVLFAGGHFLVQSERDRILTSPDGLDWVARHLPWRQFVNDAALTPRGSLLLVGNNRSVLESSPLVPWLRAESDGAGGLALELRGWPRQVHRLQGAPAPFGAAWTDVATFLLEGTHTNWTVPAGDAGRYYRLVSP